MKYKAGIIGLGQVGYLFDKDPKRKVVWTHFNAYRRNKKIKLSAVCDLNEKILDRIKSENPDIKCYHSYSDMLKNENFDILSVCTLEDSHYKIIRDIIKYQKNIKAVFCEKPIASNLADAEKIVKLCREKGVKLAVNHNKRWDVHCVKIKNLIDKKKFGELKSIVAYYDAKLFRSGIHFVDSITMFGGAAEAVIGFGRQGEFDDPSLNGIIFLKSGIQGVLISTGNFRHLDFSFELYFSQGKINILNNIGIIEYYRYKPAKYVENYSELFLAKREIIKPVSSTFINAVENIIASIEGKSELNCTGEDGYTSFEICCKIADSFKKNGKKIVLRKWE